jgi:alpha-glucosidase
MDTRASRAPASGGRWWETAVVYQVYVRSFADTNGDGVGDLRGVCERLEYLAWLGIDTLWLSPVTVSPNVDWGYDVADYYAVDPSLGTLDDLDELIGAAEGYGIRILLDLVPNHTSSAHPWFLDARSSREASHRDWYVWADPAPDGGPPNNWVSSFFGSAWEYDATTGQYYLHNFLREQPDLNWWNEAVRDEFDRILRFWFDRGVAGFRVDVAHMIVKDALLRDNPPTDERDHLMDRLRGQRQEFNSCRPEVHDVFRRWRRIADSYDPPRLLLGETHVFDLEAVASFYGNGDELGLAFNFLFLHEAFDATRLRGVVAQTESLLTDDAWPAWTLSNHDKSRFPSRWCAGDEARVRCALMLLLTLRGTPVLYFGDELGLPDTDVPDDRRRDPVSIAFRGVLDRDAARTPMPWSAAPGGGFTSPDVEPWLPFGDLAAHNVADQRADRRSTLHLVRDLLTLRRGEPDLLFGGYDDTGSGDHCWTYLRGAGVQVALNLGSEPVTVPVRVEHARIALATDRSGEGERAGRSARLGGWRGVVLVGD